MTFTGSVINEQGVTLGIALVKSYVLNSNTEANKTVSSFSAVFGFIPTVLVAQDSQGRATWFGRPDIVRYMRDVPLSAVPWREYTVN